MSLPARFDDEADLERSLSEPRRGSAEILAGLEGDVMVLGAGGKMGPTLAMLLRRAVRGEVFAVSRFSDQAVRRRMESAGIRTVSADLLDRQAYAGLPAAPVVYYLAGMKFGAGSARARTWAMNAYLPALVAEHFRESRIVAFSTGNVYPFVPVTGPGAAEGHPVDPVGEYAQSCLGRERIFEYFSERNRTPVVLIRLNYANEPRYGIILDLFRQILSAEAVDVTTGYANLIWQGDANDYIAAAVSLAASPARVLNVAGPAVSIRELALSIGRRLGKRVTFSGAESQTALLSDASECVRLFGPPRVSLEDMVPVITGWAADGGPILDKPTKFQVRTGDF